MAFKFSDLQQEYADLWKSMVIREDKKNAVGAVAAKIKSKENLYKEVSAKTGVPTVFIGIVHSLESGCDDTKHLHNGDPLSGHTKRVPKGRPVEGNPPFNWIDSAVDALKLKNLDAIKDWPVERIAYELERYNGMGHQMVPSRGNSPYLWSFTNHYTRGKFTSDGNFDPGAVSGQCGGMALLKLFIDGGEKIESTEPTPEIKSEVVPLQTGLFFSKGPFELLSSVTAQPSAMPDLQDLIQRDEPVKKIKEHGERWEIEVELRGGGTKHGFARGGIFVAQTVDPVVDIETFAQMCLDAARLNETSAHHLVAWADLETGIRNVAAAKGDGAGPFLLSAAAWAAATADGLPALSAGARFDPLKQPFVAAEMVTEATTALKSTLTDRLPTSAELYVAHLVGANNIVQVLSDGAKPIKDVLVQVLGQAPADILKAVRPWLFAGNASVKDMLTTIARRMDFGYQRADELFVRVEPDFAVETASGFAARVQAMAIEEWKFFGEEVHNIAGSTVKDGHSESKARTPPGSGENWFDRVGKYWRAVGDLSSDGRTDKAWSAAFISYVLKECNVANKFRGSGRHSDYISQAIRDFNDKADVAYWCQRLEECKPGIGDIVCWAREDGVDYDHQKGGQYKGHCDFVVEVGPTEIQVIGGNVGQSVTKRPLALDDNRRLKSVNRPGERLFAIMQNQIK